MMKCYLVGGAVRDQLLGMPVKEHDWVVTGASEQMMREQGFRQLNSDFPVFEHPDTGDEYALARRETKSGTGYHGFTIQTSPEVTLEEDLKRRDLTINAIAEESGGELIDPYCGELDLQARCLRHITPAFIEDPVRVLRVARFAAYLGTFGFTVHSETNQLLQQMSQSDEFKQLKPERVWKEFSRALASSHPWRFIEVLHECSALGVHFPLLEQTYPAVCDILERAAAESDQASVRFAALFYRAIKQSGEDAKSLCRQIKAEKSYCDLLQLALSHASSISDLRLGDAEPALALLQAGKALKQSENFSHLLRLAAALWPEKRQVIDWLASIPAIINRLDTSDLQASGLQGQAYGAALRQARLHAIELFDQQSNNPPSQ